MALRIAVVGVGFGTRVHVPAFLSEGFDVVAIAARRRERAEEAAERFGVGAVFSDYDELLAMPGLDAVSITTPPALHHDMAIAALRAGKHVICEKPFALNVTEAREMLDAAEQSGRTAMVAHEFRFASARMYTKSLLEEGYVGVPRLALVRLLRGQPATTAQGPAEYSEPRDAAASGAGFLFGIGSHYIDGLRHWFGEVEEVDGSLVTNAPERLRNGATVIADADDTFLFRLRFASGVIAEMVASRAAPFAAESSISVYGSEGVLHTPQEGTNPPAHGTVLGTRVGAGPTPELLPVPELLEPFADDRDDRLMPFRLFAREFLRGVEEASSPAPNFSDGYRCQQVLEAIRESSATGRRIRIEA